ncbi:hypothetical protein [Deinococcus multiflagellatus]|uniref:Uncharacterized protein n=1 Tax=Deinococcus multiflagellatus TaxID=1656887 RepID=A0ABW1ZQ08_9DEIO|nr:hypothetical protein [Deinococcus multiflagellatus]MBZ9715835.1 hypothetical protein [Deinococcus multiflagellatus]
MTLNALLDLDVFSDDFPQPLTLRAYLQHLFTALLNDETFSAKRPFGNGGWKFDVYATLIRAGAVTGTLDADGGVCTVDLPQAQQRLTDLVAQLLQSSAPAAAPPGAPAPRPPFIQPPEDPIADPRTALFQAIVQDALDTLPDLRDTLDETFAQVNQVTERRSVHLVDTRTLVGHLSTPGPTVAVMYPTDDDHPNPLDLPTVSHYYLVMHDERIGDVLHVARLEGQPAEFTFTDGISDYHAL